MGHIWPELFFADKGPRSQYWVTKAKAICNGDDGHGVCPVRGACLEYAIATDQQHGVWGGMSKRERRRIAGTWRRRGSGRK